MSSRKQAESRTRKRRKQTPGYVKEFAFDDQGNKVMGPDGEQAYRERPNRALTRRVAASIRKGQEL